MQEPSAESKTGTDYMLSALEGLLQKLLDTVVLDPTTSNVDAAKGAISHAHLFLSQFPCSSDSILFILKTLTATYTDSNEMDVLAFAKSVSNAQRHPTDMEKSMIVDIDPSLTKKPAYPAQKADGDLQKSTEGVTRKRSMSEYRTIDTSENYVFKKGDLVVYRDKCEACSKLSGRKISTPCKGLWGESCNTCASKKVPCTYSKGRGKNKVASLVEDGVQNASAKQRGGKSKRLKKDTPGNDLTPTHLRVPGDESGSRPQEPIEPIEVRSPSPQEFTGVIDKPPSSDAGSSIKCDSPSKPISPKIIMSPSHSEPPTFNFDVPSSPAKPPKFNEPLSISDTIVPLSGQQTWNVDKQSSSPNIPTRNIVERPTFSSTSLLRDSGLSPFTSHPLIPNRNVRDGQASPSLTTTMFRNQDFGLLNKPTPSHLTVARIDRLAATVRTALLLVQSSPNQDELSAIKAVISMAIGHVISYRVFDLPPVLDLILLQKDLEGDVDVEALLRAVTEAQDLYDTSVAESATPASLNEKLTHVEQEALTDPVKTDGSASNQGVRGNQDRTCIDSVAPSKKLPPTEPLNDSIRDIVKSREGGLQKFDGVVISENQNLVSNNPASKSQDTMAYEHMLIAARNTLHKDLATARTIAAACNDVKTRCGTELEILEEYVKDRMRVLNQDYNS